MPVSGEKPPQIQPPYPQSQHATLIECSTISSIWDIARLILMDRVGGGLHHLFDKSFDSHFVDVNFSFLDMSMA